MLASWVIESNFSLYTSHYNPDQRLSMLCTLVLGYLIVISAAGRLNFPFCLFDNARNLINVEKSWVKYKEINVGREKFTLVELNFYCWENFSSLVMLKKIECTIHIIYWPFRKLR